MRNSTDVSVESISPQRDNLILFLDDVLKARWVGEYPLGPAATMLGGQQFGDRAFGIDFFDFLYRGADVMGIELHPCEEAYDILANDFPPLHNAGYAEVRGGFPTIWFSAERVGEGHGMEAFAGDLLIGSDSRLAVLIPVSLWLTPAEVAQICHHPMLWV